MQIWLFNQLVRELSSNWHGTRSMLACRTLFLPITTKHGDGPFIHLQDCPGLLLIYVVPIDPPPPAPLTRLCVLPLFTSHGLEVQMGQLCLALHVQNTPPLILPSESLQRTKANICTSPKCSNRKKRPTRWRCVRRGVECWSHSECGEAVPCVYACLSAASDWVMWAGPLMVGVLCLLCWVSPTPFSARGLIEFTHTHVQARTHKQASHMSLMF